MDINSARRTVIEAGFKLVETGLIARTWGNVSCRIDDKRFAITPTGRPYETLAPEDIVIINISDLEYEGDIKPSSEKGVHAEVYAQKPEINFVIHTHQVNASIAGMSGKDVDIRSEKAKKVIGKKAVTAEYGLPGTKKLRKGVADALRCSDSRAVLMIHHGALCFGKDSAEAFAAAQALEEECKRFVSLSDKKPKKILHSSRRSGDKIIFNNGADEAEFDLAGGNDVKASPEVKLHLAIYNSRGDVNFIRSSSLTYIVDASQKAQEIKPVLDDFAQIIGPSLKTAEWNENVSDIRGIISSLKKRDAVLLRGSGALCVAGRESDAAAVEIVLEKGCMAYCSMPGAKAIAPLECALMRFIYKKKYSKKAE